MPWELMAFLSIQGGFDVFSAPWGFGAQLCSSGCHGSGLRDANECRLARLPPPAYLSNHSSTPHSDDAGSSAGKGSNLGEHAGGTWQWPGKRRRRSSRSGMKG